MPRTFGDGIIHISHIYCSVKVDTLLSIYGGEAPNEVEIKIVENIAENFDKNIATLQMDIGTIYLILYRYWYKLLFSQIYTGWKPKMCSFKEYLL